DEPRFSRAWLADQSNHLAMAVTRPVQGISELRHLGVTADQSCKPSRCCGLKPGSCGADPYQFEDLDWFDKPLDRHRAERNDLNQTLAQAPCFGAEPDATRNRELLHACCQVRSPSHRGVVHPEIGTDRTHHDVSGVEPNADLQLYALRAANLMRLLSHNLLH